MEESKKRSILKALTYRAILTVILAIITWFFTGDLFQTSGITIVFSIISTITYYLHERMWIKIHIK
jgi:adenylylsulfate kinase